jgi:hypothetical protein
MITSIERNEREAWAEEHFPLPTSESSDVGLELFLRDRCVKGSGYFDKAATAVNRQFYLIQSRSADIYLTYFMQGAKLEKLEKSADNFRVLCELGGYRYTNEYQYCTVLRSRVEAEVVERSRELLALFNIEVP